jgi:TruD family tRNA pseudouridine synthase
MQTSHADQSLWERERAFLAEEKKKRPELFTVDPEKKKGLLENIGITTLHPDLPAGYIRYSPLDFLVEEIDPKGRPVEIAVGPKVLPTPPSDDKGTVYADLVKIGISTLDAAQRVADGLGLSTENVRYAGIKDAVAVTAQRISVRGAAFEDVMRLAPPGVILKNLHEGKGALNVGDLQGNRFTLFIRVKPDFSATVFSNRLSDINRFGVINYYGPQRFGSPRFLSHIFGLHLMRGDLEGLLRSVLTQESPTELAYNAMVRAQAAERWGDWKGMREILETLPYGFRHEIAMLRAMEASAGPSAFEAAVNAVSQQANLWVRAYASYLANHLLSEWGRDPRTMPESLPLLLSQDPKGRAVYMDSLKEHGTERFLDHLRRFRFINIGRAPVIPTRVFPKMSGVNVAPQGVAMAFELPKAAYATTVLMHLFDTVTGMPIPEWLKPDEVDSKTLLGLGSIEDARVAFRKEIDLAMEAKQRDSEEAAEG